MNIGNVAFAGLIIIAGVFAVSFAIINTADSSIPPTRAFANVTDNTTNIVAVNYDDTLFLTAGENMTLTYFPANNTIRFTSGAPNCVMNEPRKPPLTKSQRNCNAVNETSMKSVNQSNVTKPPVEFVPV